MSPITETTTTDFASIIEANNDLLALPETVAQTIEMASDEEVSIENLSQVIHKDPALTGRILKIANSPFYGLSHKVNSVHQAVMVLGITTVRCLVLSAAIFDHSKISAELGIDIKTLYGSMISIAITCRRLAHVTGFPAPDEAFTTGILHDVGVLYFLNNFPREYRNVLQEARKSGDLTTEEEKKFGVSHSHIGELIARKWNLPDGIISAIGNHNSCGNEKSNKLDDILRLAVALNRDAIVPSDSYLEEKIVKISVISERLGISKQQLDDISITLMKDAVEFARLVEIDIGDYDTILMRANQEIFNTYMSILRLFKERQELTNKILEEEHERGILEAKHVAVSTLSHYINNSAMLISGQSQVIRLFMKTKSAEEIVEGLPRVLSIIDDAVQKIVAVLDELSELNITEDAEYFEESKILNIDERIKERLTRFKEEHGPVPTHPEPNPAKK